MSIKLGILASSRIGTPPPPNIVTNGLVLYLDAGNVLSYPGTGTLWSDISGNNNNATLINGFVFSTDGGGSIIFDGVNQYADTGLPILISNSSYTMCVWAKASTISSTYTFRNRVIGNADVNGLSGGDIIWNPNSLNTLYIVRRNGINDGTRDMFPVVSPINIVVGWHHVVVTYDHTGIGSIIYVDGVQKANNIILGFTSILPFRVARDGNGTDGFAGSVSNVELYNRALSLAEVLQNYNAQKSRFGL